MLEFIGLALVGYFVGRVFGGIAISDGKHYLVPALCTLAAVISVAATFGELMLIESLGIVLSSTDTLFLCILGLVPAPYGFFWGVYAGATSSAA
jgi:hypothetical protein